MPRDRDDLSNSNAPPAGEDPFAKDRLNYRALGDSFTRLVASIDDGRVISIESGFGQGKSFFAKAWAKHLRQNNFFVVEVNAWKNENSSDPLLSFITQLIDLSSKQGGDSAKVKSRVLTIGRQALVASAKVGLNAVSRGAAEEISNFLADQNDGDGFAEGLVNKTVEGMGVALSKHASRLIAEQLEIEKVRREIPGNIQALRRELTGSADGKIIVIVDELDRCHPDYAISFLESLKHIFAEDGYIFCLMLNSDQVEALARRRFGEAGTGELYLEKFIDLRLQLARESDQLQNFSYLAAMDLPEHTPFLDQADFSRTAAADIAKNITEPSGLTLRQIKRAYLAVEIAIRTHPSVPIDLPLLVLLAFTAVAERRKNQFNEQFVSAPSRWLPRRDLTLERWSALLKKANSDLSEHSAAAMFAEIERKYGPLIPNSKLHLYEMIRGLKPLAETHIQNHEKILRGALIVSGGG